MTEAKHTDLRRKEPAVKPGLTPTEHEHFGQTLFDAETELRRLLTAMKAAYPQRSTQATQTWAAIRAISATRAALDAAMCREHPDQFAPTVYYRGSLPLPTPPHHLRAAGADR